MLNSTIHTAQLTLPLLLLLTSAGMNMMNECELFDFNLDIVRLPQFGMSELLWETYWKWFVLNTDRCSHRWWWWFMHAKNLPKKPDFHKKGWRYEKKSYWLSWLNQNVAAIQNCKGKTNSFFLSLEKRQNRTIKISCS